MPTAIEMSEINRVTSVMDPRTAAAMRVLFIITEFQNEETDHYISTALQENGTVKETIAKELRQYDLVAQDGTIPESIKIAIKHAVETQHLEVKNRKSPNLGPSPTFRFIIQNVCGF